MRAGFGRSMGRDWGGRRKQNPPNAPKVTRQQVLNFAAENNLEVKRDGNSSWWLKKNGTWYTAGMTNYIAMMHMQEYVEQIGK